MSKRHPWLTPATALMGGLLLLCLGLVFAGRRFAARTIFAEIQTLAEKNRKEDAEAIHLLSEQLAVERDAQTRDRIQRMLSGLHQAPSGFLCLDRTTAKLFNAKQRATLEGSLKGFYPQVYWGEESLPKNRASSSGLPVGGVVLRYSYQVYPGVVVIEQDASSGVLSGGGHRDLYLWWGLSFRFYRRTGTWIA